MKLQKLIVSIAILGLSIVVITPQCRAANPYIQIAEEDVTLEKIKNYFDAAFLKSEFYKDGGLKIDDSGFKSIVNIDREKKLISMYCSYTLKSSFSQTMKLELANNLNDHVVFVRYCIPNPSTLWCEYQFLFDGGITPFTIVNNYRYFAKVVKNSVATRDPNNIIGSD